MKKTLLAAIGILGAVVVASVFYFGSNNLAPATSEDQQLTKTSVRMKWFFAGTMTGWFSGKEQGIFARHGIDLTINPGGPDNNSVKLVASGTDLFGVAGADEVFLARAKGIPVVAIGVLFKESPLCFISKKSRSISTPEDWAGKTVEVSYGSNAEVQYRALVTKYDVKNIKEVPYTFNLVPFMEDKVDVSVAYKMDQVVTLQRKGIELSIITAKEHGINPYGDVVITTEKTLHDQPRLVEAFTLAVIESQKWAIEHPEEAVRDLLANTSTLSVENESEVWKATIPFLLSEGGLDNLGAMKQERWNDTAEILFKYADLPSIIDISAAYVNIPMSDTK